MAGKYSYLKERVALYFVAKTIKVDKWVPILLSPIGARTYSFLHDLVAPVVPGTLPFGWNSEELTSNFQPRRLVIAESFQFHSHLQAVHVDESIAEFDAALRNLTTNW